MQTPQFVAVRGVHEMQFNIFAMETINSLNIREKTRNNYRSIFRCHLESQLSGIDIRAVTRQHISQALLDLPPQTRSATFAVLKSVFREALLHRLIEASPTADYRIPAPIVGCRKFLTWEEIKSSDFGRYEEHIRFLALHGLRWGEAVVLSQSDIRGGRIYVNRSIHGDTKSQAGVRVVPQISEFVPFPKSPKTLRKVLTPYGVTIHSLRHTYAYILKSQGVHVTTAQKLLGHSDVKVTLKVYTQVLDDEIEKAGDLIRLIS